MIINAYQKSPGGIHIYTEALFNQTLEVPAGYPQQVFGSRLNFFRKIRRHFDPENRMMNPYLSQYFL